MAKAYLLLGTNLGDKTNNLLQAIILIGQQAGKVICSSSVYETAPWGFESDSAFLNQAIVIDTELEPLALIKELLAIEQLLGRNRNDMQEARYSSRLMDIDILFYDDFIIRHESLTVPHPRISERRFVLMPLCEIVPFFIHPVEKKTISLLLDECIDELSVVRL